MNRRSSGRGTVPATRPMRPAVLRPGGRPGGASYRKRRTVRRASAGLTPVRAGALLALLVGIAGLYGLATSDAFAVQRIQVNGATWIPESDVLDALDLPDGQNAFAVRTADLEERLLQLPAVRRAMVSVALPDEIRVTITERVALMAWQVGAHRFLVDASGLLFAELGEAGPSGAGLPVVDDRRLEGMALGVGSTLDAVSLDAALRLGSLDRADIGTVATQLDLRVDDADGFVIHGRPPGWTAVFGFYTPTLRTTELIPGQVRLLRSLLLDREADTLKVILASDRSATWIPRSTPKPSPKPSATPKP